MKRRHFLTTSLAAAGSAATGSLHAAHHGHGPAATPGPILLSLKYGMCGDGSTVEDKFRLLKELGYDGVEMGSPGGADKREAMAASAATGLPIHGVVNSIHWHTRLSDPSEDVRRKAREGLETAIRDSHLIGGSSGLLVPAVVGKDATAAQARERSIAEIRKALPLAARLGIHILIENVWNKFLYRHDGPADQGADDLAKYIDEIGSPWVGSYFDIGNHQKYGKPAEWIRTLGKRIVKLDVKDWGTKNGFSKIGEGDVDWPEVRKALAEIRFTGWATAEVGGGDRARCAEILANMRTHLLGA
ncbi:MAG: sugar phosphate isomerase/epimerase [Akkermansiaceae bacterium]|nr:sugar phosphate isomerase/epimerase [Akkermansiaceae bacterium]